MGMELLDKNKKLPKVSWVRSQDKGKVDYSFQLFLDGRATKARLYIEHCKFSGYIWPLNPGEILEYLLKVLEDYLHKGLPLDTHKIPYIINETKKFLKAYDSRLTTTWKSKLGNLP
jgi:hypothetical protein